MFTKSYNSSSGPSSSRLSRSVEIQRNTTFFKRQACSNGCDHFNASKIEYIETSIIESLTEMEERYTKTQALFHNLDLGILDSGPFVLVSFGSVAQVGNVYLKHQLTTGGDSTMLEKFNSGSL